MSIDLEKADELFESIAEVCDYPIDLESERVDLCVTLSFSSMQFGAAVRVLCKNKLMLGASTALRSQFEALVRSIWVLHNASDLQVEKLSSTLSVESQQASKNMPSLHEMMLEIGKVPQLENLMIALNEFKSSSLHPLNSFVHSGIHAVHWTKFEVPETLIDNVFKASNGLVLLAFQGIGILTGRPDIQKEIISTAARYTSCLPASR